MRAAAALARALAVPALAAALSVAPPREGAALEAGRSAAPEGAALPADPGSSVQEALGLLGGRLSLGGLRGPGDPARPGEVVVSRRQYAAAIASYVVVWSALVALVAFLYRRAKVWPSIDPEREYVDFTKFASGPFDCLKDPKICLWSLFCPFIRFADNMSMLGIVGFWPALAIMAGAWLLNSLLGGVLVWVASSFAWMGFRQKFRQRFDMEGQGKWSYYATDCLLYLACAPCAIAQEARQLDLAARADHEAVKAQRPDGLAEALLPAGARP